MRRWSILLAMLFATASAPIAAQELSDCDSPETERRFKACSELLAIPDIPLERRATAFANRALAFSLRGQYEAAVRDYDEAIKIAPGFAVALNNRAWAYFKWGQPSQGMADVELSLRLDPLSPHSLDTRAHISQWQGDKQAAMRDYQKAMMYGGTRMVTLYQCGLRQAKLYSGPADGQARPELWTALQACIDKGNDCDPLPPDEECREATS